MHEHPTPETLDRFLRQELPAREGVGIVQHLLGGCGPCKAAVARFLSGRMGPEDLERVGEAYDVRLDRAFAAAVKAAAAHEEEARLVDEAHAALVAEGLSGVTGEAAERFRGANLCLALLRRSHELRHENPAAMLGFARLADFAARCLNPEEIGAARVTRLRVQAWAALANAQRINGNLSGAEQTLQQAFAELPEDDLQLGVELLSLQAALFAGQRRFAESLRLLEQVEITCARLGDHQQRGRALVQRGLYLGYSGDAEGAVRLLQLGYDLIDEEEDPQLALAAVHNIARFLMDLNRSGEARKVLRWSGKLYEEHAGHVDLLKRTWLEGQIAAGRGKLDDAASSLSEAMRGFEEADLGYQAALAAIDLAAVWMRQGRAPMAATLVVQATETFAAIGVTREAIVCLKLVQEACEEGVATAKTFRRASNILRRLEQDSAARFDNA